jgi:hypothetical protein
MKMLPLILLFLNLTANASTMTCKVTSPTNEGLIVIDLDRNGVNSMDLQRKTSEKIYARSPAVRGAFLVDYCNPNDNEYRDYNDSYSVYSFCTSSQMPVGKVTFQSDFSKKNGGTVSYLSADGNEQNLKFADCK